MGISKVILNGVTKVDLTQDTVGENNLLSGYTATGADGEPVTGELVYPPDGDLLGYGSNTSTYVNVGTADSMRI